MSGDKSTTAPAVRYMLIKPGYCVSDTGRVFSSVVGGCKPTIGTHWTELRPSPQYRGHMTVWLGRDDQRFVHRLVLEAFIGPCPEGMECRHLDGDPSNNRIDNLKWGTRKENHHDSVIHGTAFVIPGGRIGEENPSSKLDEPIVREIMLIRGAGTIGAKRIAVMLGLGKGMRGAVDGVIRGQSWNHVTGLPPYKPKSNKPGRRKRAGEVAATASSDNILGPDSPQVVSRSESPAPFLGA